MAANSAEPPEEPHAGPSGLARLEHRNERLGLALRFTYAFHAREIRFERDVGRGFESVFPEVFSFDSKRHDPAELYLQLDDLWSNPRRLAAGANRRDAERVVLRLASAMARYLQEILDRLESGGRLQGAALDRIHGDVTVLVQIVTRFIADKGLDTRPELRLAVFHLRKLAHRNLAVLLERRVRPEYLARYIAGEVEPFAPNEEVSDAGIFYALAGGDPDEIDRWVVGMGERAFLRWLEDVCLDEGNRAFESEASPFESREVEVLRVVGHGTDRPLRMGRELSPFLRRKESKDCARVLEKLEAWFLRQYDIHHAAVVIQHAANLERGVEDAGRVLSRHSTRNYLLALAVFMSPFVGATFAYDRAPRVFDVICSLEVVAFLASIFWFLVYRFCWQRDLTFFHAGVPRIGAGIIVGYLPVFLIDEIWDLVRSPPFTLLTVVALLGFSTLLYLYVEVQRRLGDPTVAFARARSLFLLGVLEAYALGLILTSLLGHFMVMRNWASPIGITTLDGLREVTPTFAGELPRLLGVEPLMAFPTAVLLMTFLSFFIGTFLQLMWEEIPITEPL